MADSGLRQILILKKLPREPRAISTKQLHAYLIDLGYTVSIRTIQRDLQTLSTIFPIIEPNKSNEEGWRMEKSQASQSLPVMEPNAALTLLMAQQHLGQLLPKNVLTSIHPYIDEAKATLKALDKKALLSWQNKVRIIPSSPLLPSSQSDRFIHIIYEALLRNKKILATYNDKKGSVICPYGIVQRGNQFYLICTFFDFSDIRITALQRYSDVILSDESFTINEDFNLDTYIKSGEMSWPWDGRNHINLGLEVNDWLASYLTEFPLSTDQSIQASETEGWHDLNANVLDTHELREWLLSKGDAVKITQPPELREWVVEMIDSVKNFY